MKSFLLILAFICSIETIKGQSREFIDSLSNDSSNQIIVFQSNCVGCIVLKAPCDNYKENGNPWDKYIIWKNKTGYHIKKYNNCGSSKIVTFKKWKNDPFILINTKSSEIDTTKIKYPLSFNRKDSTWFETGINHYEYYYFSFPKSKIRELEIKDYAFREISNEDLIWAMENLEFKLNLSRYQFNNKTAIKQLLDIVEQKLKEIEKKLK